MHECSRCGATWEKGNICPYCKSVSVKEKTPPGYKTEKKKASKSLVIVMVSIVSILTFLTVMVLIFTYGSFFRKMKMQNSRSKYSNNVSSQYSYSSSYASSDSSISESKKNYQKEKGIYTGDILEVGVDIPEGEYLAMNSTNSSSEGFGISIYTEPDRNRDSQIYFDWAHNNSYIYLESGIYVDATSAVFYDITKNDIELDPFSRSGMFKVGRDLDPGTYKIVADSDYSANYWVYSELNSIAPIASDSGRIESGSELSVTLHDGEYIKITDSHLSK